MIAMHSAAARSQMVAIGPLHRGSTPQPLSGQIHIQAQAKFNCSYKAEYISANTDITTTHTWHSKQTTPKAYTINR
jgi:hypothetical protein